MTLQNRYRGKTQNQKLISKPKSGFEQNKETKQLGTSAVSTSEQRESKESMVADNTDDIGKIEKKR